MKISVIAKTDLTLPTDYNLIIKQQAVLDDESDVVIVYSDDYFDDILFKQLRDLKQKYLAVFVIGFNKPELMLYNKQYVEFCFDNNINFLDYDETQTDLKTYLQENLSFTNNYYKFVDYYINLQVQLDYRKWFLNEQFENKTVVDLGSGNSQYLEVIKPLKYTGIDQSAAMIKAATKRFTAPNHQFIIGDICNYEQKSDVVISLLDVFNYLPDFETVVALLNRIYQNLNDNGMLIFDVHSKAVLTNFKNYFDYADDQNGQFIWEAKTSGNDIYHYLQIVDNDYKVYVEKHHQQYYEIESIRAKLKAIGFVQIDITEAYDHHIIRAMKGQDE